MSRVKSRDTKPEKLVRRLVYSMGYRYRLHLKNLPGSPDLAFLGKRKAIFVHGCFWHQHPGCRRATVPKTNTIFWKNKFNINVKRDEDAQNKLIQLGWQVLTIWQCETKDISLLTKTIKLFLAD